MIIGRGRTPKLLQLSFLVFVLSIAIIGRRGSKAPIPPAHRPVTRSQDPEPTTNLVSEPDVMGEYASAESVQTLQAAVTAMQTEQGEIRQMLRQLLAAKGPATDDSGSQHGSRPPAEEAQATGLSDVPAATTPKFARLEFPRFDGREDPSAWLHRCEQFFKAQNTPAREFVSLAAFHLTGVAQTWHLRLELEDPAISWRHFKQRCYLRFGPGLRGNALGMLTYVRQNGRPLEEYTDEFQEILGLTTTVRQDQEVDLYTTGLDEWLRIDVENLHPPNLDVAMNIARSSSRKQRWFSHPYAADPSFFSVPFAALIDSGSTHNFVDSATAKELGLLIRACPFLQVAVANGERITGLGVCEDVLLQKDANYFPVNLFVIPLVGFEIVLEVHWLRTLGAILWDFTALTMTFTYGGRPVTWQGDQVSPGQFFLAIQPHVNVSNALDHLLTDFSDLFQEPTALPPKRQCDHRITLVTGADPVAVRPYRYPQAQKDEIERQSPVSPLLDSLRGDLAASDTARALMENIRDGSEGPNWALDDGLIRYKVAIVSTNFLLIVHYMLSDDALDAYLEAGQCLEELSLNHCSCILCVINRMSSNRHWMYTRIRNGLLTEEFLAGLETFIQFATSQHSWMDGEKIKCPCNQRKCQNTKFLDVPTVKFHLAKYGFVSDYYVWRFHGEANLRVDVDQDVGAPSQIASEEASNAYHTMVMDAAGPEFNVDEIEESPNPEAQKFYDMLKTADQELWPGSRNLKFPDGYASNMSRCVDMKKLKLFGMKSHGCHVFMQRLIPIAFRELLPLNVWKVLTELSLFFKNLTSTTIRVEEMTKLENDIPLILCKLERIFPPSFFDSMEHLPIHLAYEARIAGPVQYRWMYPFERYLRKFKNNVKNKAKVEGSISNAYLVEEASSFCSYYFDDHVSTKHRNVPRNADSTEYVDEQEETLSIFKYPGRAFGKSKARYMTDEEFKAAQTYVLLNCSEVEPFIEIYTEELKRSQPNISSTTIDGKLENEFANWFNDYAHDPSNNISNKFIKDLAKGPLRCVNTYSGYYVNGFKFHTIGYGGTKETMNSGVCIKGINYSIDESDYYGRLVEVVQVEYLGLPVKRTILFKCEWFDPTTVGMKVHSQYKLVEVNHKRRFNRYEPFVLAMQAAQVYYCTYPSLRRDKLDWWAVCKIKARSEVEVPESSISSEESLIPPPFQEEITYNHDLMQIDEDPSHLNDPNGGVIQLDGEHGDNEDELELEEETDDSSRDSVIGDNDNGTDS
nr:uncharacterized protein LOC109179592 [Ipomoea batatas]